MQSKGKGREKKFFWLIGEYKHRWCHYESAIKLTNKVEFVSFIQYSMGTSVYVYKAAFTSRNTELNVNGFNQ